MLYNAKLSQETSDLLLEEGVYEIGFFFSAVPKGKARIRAQQSAAQTKDNLGKAIDTF